MPIITTDVEEGLPLCIAVGEDFPKEHNHDWATWYANFRRVRSGTNAVPPVDTETPPRTVFIGHMDTGYTDHTMLNHKRIEKTLGANLVEGDLFDARTPIRKLPIYPKSSLQNHGTATMSVVIGIRPLKGAFCDIDVNDNIDNIKMAPYRISKGVFLMSKDLKRLAQAIGYFDRRMREKHGDLPHVVSISLGTRSRDDWAGFAGKVKLKEIIRDYVDLGVIFVAAAGQLPVDPGFERGRSEIRSANVVFPASMKEVIGVGSIDIKGIPNPLGFYGNGDVAIDVMAPGMNIHMARSYRSATGNILHVRDEQSDGSSYATQYTAAAAAMWIRHHGKLSLAKKYGLPRITDVFRYCLKESSSPAHMDWRHLTKAGQLNLDCLLSYPLPELTEL